MKKSINGAAVLIRQVFWLLSFCLSFLFLSSLFRVLSSEKSVWATVNASHTLVWCGRDLISLSSIETTTIPVRCDVTSDVSAPLPSAAHFYRRGMKPALSSGSNLTQHLCNIFQDCTSYEIRVASCWWCSKNPGWVPVVVLQEQTDVNCINWVIPDLLSDQH